MSPARTSCLPLILAILHGACGQPSNEQGNVASDRQGFQSTPVEKGAFDAVYLEACGEGGLSSEGMSAFRRRPYLQKMTAGSVEILWTSDRSEAMSVIVRRPDGTPVAEIAPLIDSQIERPDFEQYTATIDQLEPETIYCYEVHGEGGVWLGSTGFRTAPGPDSTNPIRMIALGDLGARTPDQYAVLREIENVQYDLVLIPGDLAYDKGTLADHENNFFQVYEHIMRSIPFFVISGNHDYAADGTVFREVFALPENGGLDGLEKWYSLTWGSTHIIALDTEKVDDTQAAWLEADLAANPLSTTIAFMHRPSYSSGTHGSSATIQKAFGPLFEDYGVDLVITGHDHNYERTNPIGGVTYVVTGGGGRGTRPVGSSSFTAYSEAVAHFTHITIDPAELSLHAIDATGKDFDAVVLQR